MIEWITSCLNLQRLNNGDNKEREYHNLEICMLWWANLLLSFWSTTMVPLHMLNKGNWITKSSTAFWAYINCHLPYSSSVGTLFVDFLHMLNQRCNRGKLCMTLGTLLHLLHSAPAAAAALPYSIPCLPCLAEFTSQLCHSCFSRGSDIIEKACSPFRWRCWSTAGFGLFLFTPI